MKKKCLVIKHKEYEPYVSEILAESGDYYMINSACFLGMCTEEKWVLKGDVQILTPNE